MWVKAAKKNRSWATKFGPSSIWTSATSYSEVKSSGLNHKFSPLYFPIQTNPGWKFVVFSNPSATNVQNPVVFSATVPQIAPPRLETKPNDFCSRLVRMYYNIYIYICNIYATHTSVRLFMYMLEWLYYVHAVRITHFIVILHQLPFIIVKLLNC